MTSRVAAGVSTRIVTLVAAGWLLAVGIAQAPHTVHHLFDGGEQDAGGDAFQECAFASAADRTQAVSTPVGPATTITETEVSVLLLPAVAPRAPVRAAFPARAPPASAV